MTFRCLTLFLLLLSCQIDNGTDMEAMSLKALPSLRNGDIILSRSSSPLGSLSVLFASEGLNYSHCGVYYCDDGMPIVMHVTPTPIDFAVKCVAQESLHEFLRHNDVVDLRFLRYTGTAIDLDSMLLAAEGLNFNCKGFDGDFNWESDDLYCTEFVLKLYESMNRPLDVDSHSENFHHPTDLISLESVRSVELYH